MGLGVVVSWAVEALARSGVGHLTIIDGDDISYSNVNRQCHTLESTIGQMKAKVMKQRILDINPDCDCQVIEQFLTDENISDLLLPNPAQKFDCVIDAIAVSYTHLTLPTITE